MKAITILTILIIAICASLLAQSSEKQEQVTLGMFLDSVSKEFDVTFSYSKDFLPLNSKIQVSNNHSNLKATLDNTFANQPISYKWIGESVVLKKKPRPILPNKSYQKFKSTSAAVKLKKNANPKSKPKTISLNHHQAKLDYLLNLNKPRAINLTFIKQAYVPLTKPVFDKRIKSITAFNPLDYRMPRMIVLQAFERIEDNFFLKQQTFKGYFREIFLEDKQPVSLVDAMVKIDDRGYKQIKTDQTGLESVQILGVRSTDNNIRPEFSADFERFNSLRALLNWNEIKYRDKDEEINIGKTTYVLDSSILVNGGLIYVFTSSKGLNNKIHKTTYHIDAETSAIYKVIYSEKSKSGHYLDQQWRLTGNQDYVFKAKETRLTYTFGSYMNKMYLKSIEELSYADVFNSWDDNVAWEFGCQRQMVLKPAFIPNKASIRPMNDQKSLALQTTAYKSHEWQELESMKEFVFDKEKLAHLEVQSSLEQQFQTNAQRIK